MLYVPYISNLILYQAYLFSCPVYSHLWVSHTHKYPSSNAFLSLLFVNTYPLAISQIHL